MERLLVIRNIIFSTGINARRVRASGILEEGGALVVRGPSGAGKTTFLRCLARLRGAESGQVFLAGKLWTEFTPSQWRRRIHYLAQKPVLFDGTVLQNLQAPFELAAVKKDVAFDRQKALELMESLLLPAEMGKQDARTLSGGEAARMALVRAVLVKPSVLLLDEPFAALDTKAGLAVRDFICRWVSEAPGRGALLVSHAGGIEGLSRTAVLELEGVDEQHAGE